MRIDDKTIDHIASLARLKFDEESRESIKQDLDKILGMVEKLNEVDTEGVEPLIYVNEGEDTLRVDKVTYMSEHNDALKNAPDKDSDYIRVPKVLDSK